MAPQLRQVAPHKPPDPSACGAAITLHAIEPIDLGIPGLTNIERIGAGGNAVVYRARQPDLDRSVVIKVLLNLDAATTRRRFDRERKAMGRLSQAPGIAPLYGSGFTPSGRPYLLMPFYEQGSLQDRLTATGPLDAREVQEIGVAIANAVHTAHENDVLHRDLKPANILMTRRGAPDVADFGIARLVDDALGTSQALTMTPLYTAPEAFDGVESGVLADVYSLGATLFALLQGYPAHGDPTGNTPVLSLMRRINEEPLPEFPATVPHGLASVISQAMSRNPADRPATAGELASLLRAADMTVPKLPRQKKVRVASRRFPVRIAAAGAALVLLIGGGVVAAFALGGDDDGGDETVDAPQATVTAIARPTPTALSVSGTGTGDEPDDPDADFDVATATAAARQALVRVEAYSCGGVDVATGVLIDDGVVITTREIMRSPWYVDVSAPGRVRHVVVEETDAVPGLGFLSLQGTGDNGANSLPQVSVAPGDQVAIVGLDGKAAVATIRAPEDPKAYLQASLADDGSGNAVEIADAVVTEAGALVGVSLVGDGVIEVLSSAEVRAGEAVSLDYDCPPAFDRELGPADSEAVVSPAIGELLAMQQLQNAYAAEQWQQVRRIEPAKRVYTDEQFVNGWRGLRQGFVFPVERQLDADGTPQWRIGLIGYETWNGSDVTTLFCLTWSVNPTSGAVTQSDQDDVVVYGVRPGQDRRNGFIRPASLRPLILENCPLDPSN